MLVEVINSNGIKVGFVRAEPICGQHFCDRCGDCLYCSGFFDSPCYYYGQAIDWGHDWVHYTKKGKLFQ